MALNNVGPVRKSTTSFESTQSHEGFPKLDRRKSRQMTIAEYDVTEAKSSVAKRLLLNNNLHEDNSHSDAVIGEFSTVRTKSFPRVCTTQLSLLPRDQGNRHVTPQLTPESPENVQTTDVSSPNPASRKDNKMQNLYSGVSVNTRNQVLDIIENPELQFDDEKYAADGALRTVHMLPEPSAESFAEAKRARYLRWRDPEVEKELDICDIFPKNSNNQCNVNEQHLNNESRMDTD